MNVRAFFGNDDFDSTFTLPTRRVCPRKRGCYAPLVLTCYLCQQHQMSGVTQLHSWPSALNSLVWSQDCEIAVAAGENVEILVIFRSLEYSEI